MPKREEREFELTWSSQTQPVPCIGATVRINFNGLGTGTVVGYFCNVDVANPNSSGLGLDNYLGVQVRLDNPPKWWVEQNPGRSVAWVFGREIDPT